MKKKKQKKKKSIIFPVETLSDEKFLICTSFRPATNISRMLF